jgi:hypothetical protein
MDKPTNNPVTRPDSEGIVEVLFRSAADAFLQSILVTVFGSIVIGLAGGIWQQMIPSAPPGFGETLQGGPEASARWHSWTSGFEKHRLLIVFVLILIPTVWAGLAGGRAGGWACEGPTRVGKIRRNLSRQWFRLIVGNAFGAMISAMVILWVQRFSLTSMVVGGLLGWALGAVERLLGSAGQTLGAWMKWYGQNQLKFTFWVLYLAAVCDDLGIPNLKTLGRWLGRRLRKRINSDRSPTPTSTS